jgi:hypothetical protein
MSPFAAFFQSDIRYIQTDNPEAVLRQKQTVSPFTAGYIQSIQSGDHGFDLLNFLRKKG